MLQYISTTYLIITLVVGAGVGWFIFGGNGNGDDGQFVVAETKDFTQEVSVSGRVIPAQDVDLAFNQTGRVEGVFIDVGDVASRGAVLAALENDDAQADVLQKEAAKTAAQAKLQALLAGTREEEVAIKEALVDDALLDVAKANQTLINTLQKVFTVADNAVRNNIDQLFVNPRTSNPDVIFTTQYASILESERVAIEETLRSWTRSVAGGEVSEDASAFAVRVEGYLSHVRSFLALVGDAVNDLKSSGSLSAATIDGYRADVATARTNVDTALSDLIASDKALRVAESALVVAERELLLARAGATKETLDEQEANLKVAEANLLQARARLQKTLITAPFFGTITRVDAEAGEAAAANASLISMISTDVLQIESFVPEINISLVSPGDMARIVLDAYGDAVVFDAVVTAVDPAETIRDGVSTYKTTLEFVGNDERIRPGMTANIVITTEQKSDVLVIPLGTIVFKNGDAFVRVKNGEVAMTREIVVGDISSLGEVEIIHGLRVGDKIMVRSVEE